MKIERNTKTILYVITEDWYFWSHRLNLARAARDAGWDVHVATRLSQHERDMKAEGFRVHEVGFHRSGLNPFRDIKTLIELVSLNNKLKPDLVHNVAAKPVLYGSIAGWICRIPALVNTMAGMGFLYTSDSVKTRFARSLFMRLVTILGNRRGRKLIVQNADDHVLFRRYGLAEKQIALIRGSGVDLAHYSAVEEPAGLPVALCVSRLLRDKGIGELVEAARLLKQRKVPITIRILGGSDKNPSNISETVLKDWAAEGVVDLPGHSDRIAEEYAKSHFAVLPSYREGLPKALLEAAACGRPIIATDVPGCREICLPNKTGLLVPPKDPSALADAMEILARDASLRIRLGKEARRLAETRFSNEIVIGETLAVYRSLSPEATSPAAGGFA